MGFPEGYTETFKRFYVFDRMDTKQIRFVCGNEIAASVKPSEPFPYGSVLVFESWRPRQDTNGNLIKDANGHLIRETLNVVFVMRKEKGFGEAYGALRNGEWEYVAYRPNKGVFTAPQNTANCAACHLGAGQEKDWVFRTDLFFTKDRYGQTPSFGHDAVVLSSMAFAPNTLTIKVGTTVKWTNSATDKINHTATAADRSFDSGLLKPGESFRFRFEKTGTYQYICGLHPEQMRATVRVTE